MAAGALSYYGYIPSLPASIVFLALFALLTLTYTVLTFRLRRDLLWLFAVSVGGIAEIMGWAARLVSSRNSRNANTFLIQMVVLILGPAFFSGALYGLLTTVMHYVDPKRALLRPRILVNIFIVCDIISLVIQAIGGGDASKAVSNPGSGPPSQRGTKIMTAGIAFQLVVMCVFMALGVVYYVRTKSNLRWHRLRLLVAGSTLASLMIILRGIFRTIELSEGWNGRLYTHEVYLLALDAAPMVVCMLALCASHPSWSLPTAKRGSEGIDDRTPPNEGVIDYKERDMAERTV